MIWLDMALNTTLITAYYHMKYRFPDYGMVDSFQNGIGYVLPL